MNCQRRFIPILICAVMLTGGMASAQEAEKPHFHHIHINSVDPAESIDFYETMFSAVPVKFRGASDAVLTD